MPIQLIQKVNLKKKLIQLKKDYRDARHHCYAFRLGADLKEHRFSDDGEPSSSAGKPIYGQIQSFELTNISIVVIRYFGGTKLGVGGLITAYKEAAKDALNNANIISQTVNNIYEIRFDYTIMSDVINFIKKNKLEIKSQILEEIGVIQFSVRLSNSTSTINKFKKIDGLKIELIRTI